MRPKEVVGGLAAVILCLGPASAQDSQPPAAQSFAARAPGAKPAAPEQSPASALQTGPATVAPHWSKNKFPESIPEGATYYIVERNDTLWDLSQRFLGNPYLWPQIWDQNRYIADAHWIYPGDPLILPKVALLAEGAGGTGLPSEGLPGEGELGLPPGAEGGPGMAGAALTPLTEEFTMQCADYIVQDKEDDSLQILGSEQGSDKTSFGDRDVVYLNKGSNAGVKAGDMYTIHYPAYPVRHPSSGKFLGTKIATTGWLQVVLVHENTATAVIEQACIDVHAGNYLKPYETLNVPLVLTRPAGDRLTPPSGKLTQTVIDIRGDAMIAATGQLITIDAGSEAGVAPGNVFLLYRIIYPSVPTPRNVIGEAAVITVRDRSAVAKITYANDAIMVGDGAELR